MSKKKKMLMAEAALFLGVLGSNPFCNSSCYLNDKQLEGSPIYIPKRHKFKRRNKR